MTRRRITMNEVATASGTSPASVSLALRNKPGVSRDTRERILRAAQDLGYKGAVRAGKSESLAHRNVALIFRTWSANPEETAPAVSPFYSSVMTGIQEAGIDSAMNLLLGTIPVNSFNSPGRLPRSLLAQPLDGILLVGSFNEDAVRKVLECCSDPPPALVLVDAADTGNEVDAVFSDNFGGGYTAAKHLIDAGHREISWVGSIGVRDRNFEWRFEGFARALADHDLTPTVINNHTDVVEWKASLDEVLSNSTASFCANDSTAISLLRECHRRGIRVPDDHSVAGFDDIIPAHEIEPALTTMAVDKLSMGRVAIEMLEYRMKFPEAATMAVSLKPRFVSRGSVKWISEKE